MSDKEKVSGEEVEVVAWMDDEGYIEHSYKPWMEDRWQHLMTVAQHQRITDALRGEVERTRNMLLEVTTRHFAESWKNRSSDKMLEEYLSVGIAQLEAERDQLRAEVERLKAQLAQQQVPGWKLVPVEPTPEMVSAAYQRQSVVMPNRMTDGAADYAYARYSAGWNACLDEFARLNGAGSHE